MTANEYQKLAARTMLDEPGFDITAEHIELVREVLLVARRFGGYVVEKVKKGVFHQHGIDVEEITEDLRWVSSQGNLDYWIPEITEENVMVVWNLMGLLGEAFELIELWATDESDPARWAEEVGDAEWYLAALATKKGLRLADVLAGNIEKLKERYPDGFSSEASRGRRNL